MLVFGAIRLSYFSTFGLSSDAKYTGLAIDNNSIILVFLFMFSQYFEKFGFSIQGLPSTNTLRPSENRTRCECAARSQPQDGSPC